MTSTGSAASRKSGKSDPLVDRPLVWETLPITPPIHRSTVQVRAPDTDTVSCTEDGEPPSHNLGPHPLQFQTLKLLCDSPKPAIMSATQIPAGKTWFDVLKVHFSDVPIGADQGISTSEFIDASEATTTLFDLLGSVAFTPVKNDMLGNVGKVRDRLKAAPAESTTLQSLVKAELASKSHKATEGLLWLVRGLDFTAQALRADITANSGISVTEQKPAKELSEGFRTSYKNTLAPHHSFLIKPVFSAAMSATPYRKDFYAKVAGEGTSPEVVKEQLEKWVSALEERVSILKTFLASKEAKW